MKTWQKAWMIVLCAMVTAAFTGVVRADEDALAECMDVINKNTKKLRKDIKDSSLNAESAKLAAEASQQAAKAKEMVPPIAKNASGADKEKIIAGYKKMMAELVDTFAALEKALKENKNDAAEEIYLKLLDLKKKGHDAYTE